MRVLSFLTFLFFSVCVLVLTGCSGFTIFPDTTLPAQNGSSSLGSISGNDYGGHAPIIGAHVFVLEVNPTATGYGQLAKSLLTSNSANAGFPTAQDTTLGSPTNGMYYVTTSSNGQFFLSGDYSCDIGAPVYLYASGGNPSAPYPTQNLTITAANISGSGPYTVVLTDNSLVYQGETVIFSGSGGNLGKFLNGTTQTVLGDGNLTATSFAISVPSLTNNGVTLTTGSQSSIGTLLGVQAVAPSNAAIVNMAMLGVCGDTSPTNPTQTATANFSGLNFVYMNEVSTVATAEAMAGFFQTPTYAFNVTPSSYTNNGITITPGAVNNLGTITFKDTGGGASYTVTGATVGPQATGGILTLSTTVPLSNLHSFTFTGSGSNFATFINGLTISAATYITSDALHISVPSGHPSATLGLQSAARNAAMLYDIQGLNNIGNNGGNGDARIARSVTPANANGVVPQALLDTLGNILANCVDSANLYGAMNTGAIESSQCSVLFSNATSDGTTSGLKPYDIATAAINIAKHPAGEPSGNNTFVSNLFNSPTGNVPFVPNLASQPNDFSVGISYSGNGLVNVTGVAIDASGDAWVTAGGTVVEYGPQGSPISGNGGFSTANGGTLNTVPAIDTLGNIWFVNNGTGVYKMNSAGVLQSSGNGYDVQGAYPRGIAIDANNNVWVNNYYGDATGIAVTELSQAGAILKNIDTNPTRGAISGPTVLRNTFGIALDGSGLIWVDGYSTENVASINTSNYAVNWYNNSGSQASFGPRYLAIDQNNQIWLPNYYLNGVIGAGNYLNTILASAATASGTANSYNYPYGYATGGGLNGNNQVTVDGGNNIWVMGANNYISEFSNAGVPLTPVTGYTGGFPAGTPIGVGASAIDLSGNLWISTPNGNGVIQMIGVATPVLTPIVAAAKTGMPATKP